MGATTHDHDPKATLQRYLTREREVLLARAEGLGEHDVRRPLTRTGTNLLGLVKHVGSVQLGYLHEAFGGTHDLPMPWFDDDAEVNADMWATADESREEALDFFRASTALCDATVASLDLDARGEVPWWPPERREISLFLALVHVLDEVAHHAGHADIVRELVDGAAGDDRGNLPDLGDDEWAAYRERLEASAVEAARRAGEPA
ncbi:putative damage-inducible protein DinB [Cellulosimicrobium cellulans]|uniref:DinB family protein n=1 Tax=Cellulosimicrobium cellulans TaxID=1710 RepID=UPI00195DD18B|nr:DinB family protein [Cellulosimicrobium cellulans]MBM7818555.1 putative damage-inducible protein DinB [Cellulosimicrobium cellulans]